MAPQALGPRGADSLVLPRPPSVTQLSPLAVAERFAGAVTAPASQGHVGPAARAWDLEEDHSSIHLLMDAFNGVTALSLFRTPCWAQVVHCELTRAHPTPNRHTVRGGGLNKSSQ